MKLLLILLTIVLIAILLYPEYHQPRIYKGFISHEVCDYIIKNATPKLETSVVSMDKTVNDNIRKSETAWLGPEDPIIKSVMQNCVSKTDRQIKNCERLQVLRYVPGGFYKPHQDAFSDDKNMRMHTCIIALNDDYNGGETEFPEIGKKYKLKKGDMLLFDTLNDWGVITPKALHSGNPVTSGEKWICNLWIRTYPYMNA